MDTPQKPLYEIKANLFKGLAHPVRIRVLELLTAGEDEVTVSAMLEDLEISPSHLSGHLAILKRHGVVSSRRDGSYVYYRAAHPAVAELLRVAREFLLESLASNREHLAAAASLPPVR